MSSANVRSAISVKAHRTLVKRIVDNNQGASVTERAAKRKAFLESVAQRNEGLRQLGEFFFEFSQLEFTIKFAVSNALKLEEGYFNIVTGPYDFSVLCTVAQKILEKKLPKSKDAIADVFSCHTLPTALLDRTLGG